MPIKIKYGAVGALGRAAVSAGRAAASQMQASRDIQITSMALAAQSQKWQIEAREREGLANRAFAMQQAAAKSIGARRPATGDALAERQQLRRSAAEAKASGIYTPVQVRQMEIFADLGDATGFRGIASRVEKPSSRRTELQKQAIASGTSAQKNIDVLQRRLGEVKERISRYSPEARKMFAGDPELFKLAPPEMQGLFAQGQQLEEQIENIRQDTAAKQQLYALGVDTAQQEALGMRKQAQISRSEAAAQARVDKQVTAAGKLSDLQDAKIAVARGHAKEIRVDYGRETTLLQREFGQYEDESDADYKAREQSIWNQLAGIEGKIQASYNEERKEIQKIMDELTSKLDKPSPVVKQFVTDRQGRRFEFTRMKDGKPHYRRVN